ncbi:MAG: hypothetical protein K8F60_10115 [Melioribacteraceae bacterium]|nr:hypothetical protein [Melioribacteraceae bacterium]
MQRETPSTSLYKLDSEKEILEPIVEYFPNGLVKRERQYTDDQILLKEKIYSENGDLLEVINYKKSGIVDAAISFSLDDEIEKERYFFTLL